MDSMVSFLGNGLARRVSITDTSLNSLSIGSDSPESVASELKQVFEGFDAAWWVAHNASKR